jgi:hypothetical protein
MLKRLFMKYCKSGFLAIIAIAAMSFTITTETEIVNKFSMDENDCFLPTASIKGKFCCTCPLIDLGSATCASASSYVGLHIFVFAISGGEFIESQSQTASCPGGSIFCCFNIVLDNSPLLNCLPSNPNQPLISINGGTAKRYKVGTIRCHD